MADEVVSIMAYNQTWRSLDVKFHSSGRVYVYEEVSEFMYRRLRSLISKQNWSSAVRLLNSLSKAVA